MSVQAMNFVFEFSEATGLERQILQCHASHAHGATPPWTSFAGVTLVTHECRASRKGVQKALRRLQASGRLRDTGERRGGAVVYEIAVNCKADDEDREARIARRADEAARSPHRSATGEPGTPVVGGELEVPGGEPERQNGTRSTPEPSGEPSGTNRDDDASARDRSDDTFRKVAAILGRVPQWATAIMLGGDAAILTLLDTHPDAPWVELAGEAVASRQDPASGIASNSPRQALGFVLGDHLSGRRFGNGRPGTPAAQANPWDDVRERLRVAVCAHRNEWDTLCALRQDVPLATLLVSASWQVAERALRGPVGKFETNQAERELRRAWEGLQPSVGRVEQRLVDIDRAITDHCVRGGIDSRHDQGYSHPPLDPDGR